jgi:hypothetical protein
MPDTLLTAITVTPAMFGVKLNFQNGSLIQSPRFSICIRAIPRPSTWGNRVVVVAAEAL